MAAIGIILLFVGAIITFAIDRAVEGVDLDMIGWIVMGGGALCLIVAAIQGAAWMGTRRNKFQTERHVSADGQHYVEETKVA